MQIEVSLWPKAENLAASVNIPLVNLELFTIVGNVIFTTFKSFLEYFFTSSVSPLFLWCGSGMEWSGSDLVLDCKVARAVLQITLEMQLESHPNNPRNAIGITFKKP